MTQEHAEEPTWPLGQAPGAVLVPAWVIEHPNSDPQRPLFYACDTTPGAMSWRWTAEPSEALRFARRYDAQRVAGAKGYLHARLVERHYPAGR